MLARRDPSEIPEVPDREAIRANKVGPGSLVTLVSRERLEHKAARAILAIADPSENRVLPDTREVKVRLDTPEQREHLETKDASVSVVQTDSPVTGDSKA